MEILLNELSLHGQFTSIHAFHEAIRSIMNMRNTIRQFGRELYCHRNVAQAQVTPRESMQQAVQQFESNERRAVMVWLTQHGPFWEDDRIHSANEYLEYQGQVVTDTALGEAVIRCFRGHECNTLSLTPSNWGFSPIPVAWQHDDKTCDSIEITNHWNINTLETALQTAAPPIKSWEQLNVTMRNQCASLTFFDECFEPLKGTSFNDSAAKRLVDRLKTLDKYKGCFDEHGQRTPEGDRIYQDYFTGDKAWFTDSSESEKHNFKSSLTFLDPENKKEHIFCPWHGKINTPKMRIHFSWPISQDKPLHVVYIGHKLTKK